MGIGRGLAGRTGQSRAGKARDGQPWKPLKPLSGVSKIEGDRGPPSEVLHMQRESVAWRELEDRTPKRARMLLYYSRYASQKGARCPTLPSRLQSSLPIMWATGACPWWCQLTHAFYARIEPKHSDNPPPPTSPNSRASPTQLMLNCHTRRRRRRQRRQETWHKLSKPHATKSHRQLTMLKLCDRLF